MILIMILMILAVIALLVLAGVGGFYALHHEEIRQEILPPDPPAIERVIEEEADEADEAQVAANQEKARLSPAYRLDHALVDGGLRPVGTEEDRRAVLDWIRDTPYSVAKAEMAEVAEMAVYLDGTRFLHRAYAADHGVTPCEAFLLALGAVESSWRFDAPAGDGDNVSSVFQIRPAYLEDSRVSDFTNTVEKELEVVLAYMRRYQPMRIRDIESLADALDITGGEVTYPIKQVLMDTVYVLARTHNGGPRGADRASTRAYGDKVLEEFAELIEYVDWSRTEVGVGPRLTSALVFAEEAAKN